MENLYSIFFGFPSITILILLGFIGIYQTIKDIIFAVKTRDYEHIFFIACMTALTGLIGWAIGGYLLHSQIK